jgi:hypothetical protein
MKRRPGALQGRDHARGLPPRARRAPGDRQQRAARARAGRRRRGAVHQPGRWRHRAPSTRRHSSTASPSGSGASPSHSEAGVDRARRDHLGGGAPCRTRGLRVRPSRRASPPSRRYTRARA